MNSFGRMYPNLSASDLSNIIMKGKGVTSMSLLEKDAGFCSGSSEHEDDHHSHDDLHSPTDASEDSVEVKFTPISKNKRKSSEPSRVVVDPEQGPLKKRFRYEHKFENESHHLINSHFRPWAPSDDKASPADLLIRHPAVTTLHRAITSNDIEQDQPLELVSKKSSISQSSTKPSKASSYESSIENLIKKTQISRISQQQKAEDIHLPQTSTSSVASSSASIPKASSNKPSSQRNYKNMTRERRIEANARERTRVHTISAAYDTLRKAIPSYSNTQKLSKLSVLRVACSYILTLSRMTGEDFSVDQSEPPVQDCIDSVTRTIQTEGKLRRKKDE
ncbi:CLUMA_CG007430, isoform A [Clunio marinus]|uniref:CLUMA_CG007430, isoform A n=1 Tax=Clunio marinus TaxID=568069 RepID=A0A1J1I0M8_9DIPT|nr:CLUMA_CG007430, isoform A [Clunio marinus]